jgi:hypothetical protein
MRQAIGYGAIKVCRLGDHCHSRSLVNFAAVSEVGYACPGSESPSPVTGLGATEMRVLELIAYYDVSALG